MAIIKRKRRPRRAKAQSGSERSAEAQVPVHEGEENVTGQDERLVFPEAEAWLPVEDEAPVAARDEARVGAEEVTPVAAQGETSNEDAVRVVGAEAVPGPAGDEVPVAGKDEAQARPDTVRFIVEDEMSSADGDTIEIKDKLPSPVEESTPAPHGDAPQPLIEVKAPVIPVDEMPTPIREVEKEEESLGRRKHARFVVKGGAKGRVAVVWDAVLLNLSLGGALIEHTNVVRSGTPSSLELEPQGKKIRLRCRVARSVADRLEEQPDGEQELVYRTGLQFVEPSEETLQVIGDYLDLLTEAE